MRAAWYDRPGPAREVFSVGELPCPPARPGELLVEVRASGINPSDYKQRANGPKALTAERTVPHSDGAGIVVAVGAGVDPARIGSAVWIWNAVHRHGYDAPAPDESGTAAEYVAVPESCASDLPASTSFEVAACLGVPAFTAYAGVFADGPVADSTILVQGGAGSVGELAVQLAAAAGATVITTVSSAQAEQRARDSGAHHVINYRENEVAAAVLKIIPQGVDKIVEVDFAANIRVDAKVVAPYGTIASYSSTSNREPVIPYYDLQYKAVSVRTIQVFTMPTRLRAAAVDSINSALERRELRPTIAATFPLEDIAAAHEAAENRPGGNVVVTP